jgi:hypothetical protein
MTKRASVINGFVIPGEDLLPVIPGEDLLPVIPGEDPGSTVHHCPLLTPAAGNGSRGFARDDRLKSPQ